MAKCSPSSRDTCIEAFRGTLGRDPSVAELVGLGVGTKAEEEEHLQAEVRRAGRREAERASREGFFDALRDHAESDAEVAVLDFHRPRIYNADLGGSLVVCLGCDADTYAEEPPLWPCSTIGLLARLHGLEVPCG